jgi:hypothetical protein
MADSLPPSVRTLELQLASVLRPPVKASPSVSRRACLNASVQCRFRAMCDYALAHGWSWRRIAREAECTVQHVQECYRGSRNVPGWLCEVFPPEAQAEAVRLHIEQLRKAG